MVIYSNILLLAHILSYFGLFFGYASLLPTCKVMRKILLVDTKSESLKKRQAYLNCQKSSDIYVKIRPNWLISLKIDILKYISAIN